jgi:hypothetical protein
MHVVFGGQLQDGIELAGSHTKPLALASPRVPPSDPDWVDDPHANKDADKQNASMVRFIW